MAEAAVYTQLSGVTALGNRIYPLVLPQNVTYPAAVYQRIAATRISGFGRDVEEVPATIQVDVYGAKATGYAAFYNLAGDVRAVLQRQRISGAIDMFLDAERDDYEEDTSLYRKSFDVRVWYRES